MGEQELNTFLNGASANEREMEVKITDVVVDNTLYPRMGLDRKNVESIRESLRIGVHPPPILIDSRSRKLVDGLHRLTAYLEEKGKDFSIRVKARRYESDVAIFVDAMSANSHHGLKLSKEDQKRCADVCQKMGIESSIAASALRLATDTFKDLPMTRSSSAKDWTSGNKKSYNISQLKKELGDDLDNKARTLMHIPPHKMVPELIDVIKASNVKEVSPTCAQGIIWGFRMMARILEARQ